MKKQLYTIFIVIGCCIATVNKTEAQCNCANGAPADSVVYTFTLPPTSNFNSPITFPKFDPAIGTLTCVSLVSNISAVSNLAIRNLDSVQRDYAFLYTQAIGFSGPGGLSTNSTASLYYGPTTLDPYNSGVDSVHYGPDTPFKNFGLSKTITNTSPYLGTGTVTVNFTNTGSTLLLQGSNNYQSTVTTYAWGDFRIRYFWCEAGALASGIRNFVVLRKDNSAHLSWEAENELPNTIYEVQISTDGRKFSSLTGLASRVATSGQTASYQYRYDRAAEKNGKVFFRIRQIDPNGKTAYSSIKVIDFSSAKDGANITIYPNPIIRDLTVSFKTPQTGKVKVDIVNAVGQILYSKSEMMSNQAKLDVSLSKSIQRGTYYLRIYNLHTNETQTEKIFLQ